MDDAKLLPVEAVMGLGLAQMRQQAMAQFADRYGWLSCQLFQQLRRRGIAKQIESVSHQRQRGTALEKLRFRQVMALTPGQDQAMRKGQFALAIFQVWHQFRDLAAEFNSTLRTAAQLKPSGLSPPCQPVQQLQLGQDQRLLRLLPLCRSCALMLRQPLDEFPISGRKQLLLMRSPSHEVEQ